MTLSNQFPNQFQGTGSSEAGLPISENIQQQFIADRTDFQGLLKYFPESTGVPFVLNFANNNGLNDLLILGVDDFGRISMTFNGGPQRDPSVLYLSFPSEEDPHGKASTCGVTSKKAFRYRGVLRTHLRPVYLDPSKCPEGHMSLAELVITTAASHLPVDGPFRALFLNEWKKVEAKLLTQDENAAAQRIAAFDSWAASVSPSEPQKPAAPAPQAL